MPTYDFTCLDCRKRFDVFMTYKEYGAKPVTCSHCGSGEVRRRVNRIRVLKGEQSHMESLANPAALDAMGDDPRAMAKMFKELGAASGEELPPQFDEIVDRLDAGQSPGEIEAAVPDLGESLEPQSFGGGHDHED
jgi:putative FmdB family regulatory protein